MKPGRPDLSGLVLVDRYEIAEQLGDESRSRTYRGRDLREDQDVALKILGLDEVSDWVEMESFEREIAVLEGLDHRSIPAYRDSFRTTIEDHEYLVLVAEYLPGPNLAQIINSGRRVSDKSLRNLITTILETLAYIHELHPPLLHLSVCPENVVLSDRWHLVDFDATGGSARSQDAPGLSGDQSYSAPEVAGGEAVAQSDLYSLGKCVQFVLTGAPDGDLDQLERKPGDKTVAFVRTLCQPSPARRFSSARAALKSYRGRTGAESSKKTKKQQTKKANASGGFVRKALKKPLRTAALVIPFGLLAFFAVRGAVVGIRVRVHAPVVEAATRGNVVELKDLLDSGKSPRARDENNVSALNQALVYQELRAARLLIEAGADVDHTADLRSPGAGPAIAIAALYGNVELIGLLCDAGARVNVRDYSGATPLTLSIGRGEASAVRLLVEAGADIQMPDSSGVPPLIHAIHASQVDIARLLVESGARVDITPTGDSYSAVQAAYAMYAETDHRRRPDWLPLLTTMAENSASVEFASAYTTFALLDQNKDDYQTITILLGDGTGINKVDNSGNTALMRATKLRRTETVDALLRMGADPNSGDDEISPLLFARQIGHEELVSILKSHGATETISEENLVAAARMGDVEAVAYLLGQGVDVNSSDERGVSVFMYAVASGDKGLIDVVDAAGATGEIPDHFVLEMVRSNLLEGVRVLRDRGHNLDVAARSEGTTLDIAVGRGYPELAKLLWEAGVSHNLTQDTFVREAVRNNHRSISTYLGLGFQPAEPNSRGETALFEATSVGAEDVLAVLFAAGVDPNTLNETGRTPLMFAASRGDETTTRYLLANGAEINHRRSTGETALSMAIYNRESDISILLLNQGADPEISFETGWSDRRGNTPLELARFYRLGEVVDLLIEMGVE